MDCALLLDQIISNIEKENFKCEFVNSGFGSYHYSEEFTDLFKILESAKYRAIFDDNIESYSYADKKKLDQNTDPEQYTLIDCVIVLNWIWHVEAGIAVGTIMKKLKDGSYLKTLKQFRKFMK